MHAIVKDETNAYILGGHHRDSSEMNLLDPMMAGFNPDGTFNWVLKHPTSLQWGTRRTTTVYM